MRPRSSRFVPLGFPSDRSEWFVPSGLGGGKVTAQKPVRRVILMYSSVGIGDAWEVGAASRAAPAALPVRLGLPDLPPRYKPLGIRRELDGNAPGIPREYVGNPPINPPFLPANDMTET